MPAGTRAAASARRPQANRAVGNRRGSAGSRATSIASVATSAFDSANVWLPANAPCSRRIAARRRRVCERARQHCRRHPHPRVRRRSRVEALTPSLRAPIHRRASRRATPRRARARDAGPRRSTARPPESAPARDRPRRVAREAWRGARGRRPPPPARYRRAARFPQAGKRRVPAPRPTRGREKRGDPARGVWLRTRVNPAADASFHP